MATNIPAIAAFFAGTRALGMNQYIPMKPANVIPIDTACTQKDQSIPYPAICRFRKLKLCTVLEAIKAVPNTKGPIVTMVQYRIMLLIPPDRFSTRHI